MPSTLNIAAYQFHPLQNLPEMQASLHAQGEALGVLGTILLAHEGINCFLAGHADACRGMLAELRKIPGLEGLEAKESWSQTVPFRKFKVKIKREIIRMDHPTIRPAEGRAPAVDAITLQRWLDQGHDDQGRPVRMLDTRNDYEASVGRFQGAIDWNIQKFTEFPGRVAERAKDDLAGATVVSYCTGGIRCEKAALYMQALGHPVLQLEGGILKYLELTDGRHWEGECYVFDERRTVDTDLQPGKMPIDK